MIDRERLQKRFDQLRGELDRAVLDEAVARERMEAARSRKEQLTGALQELQALIQTEAS